MPNHLDCPCSFPETVSFQCAIEIAKLVKSGEAMNQKAHIGQHAACLLGSIARQFDTDNPPVVFGASGDAQAFATPEAAADYVLANCPEPNADAQTSDTQFGAINPMIWQAIIAMILPLLQKLFS